jgi:hypothetical protein
MTKSFAFAVGYLVPLVVWLLVFVAARERVFGSRSMLRVVSVWRVLSGAAALVLLICAPLMGHLWIRYFWCAMGFSLNLFLPQQWLQKQLKRDEPSEILVDKKWKSIP